ncbi:hypothetical protein [Pedobacter caeni]|uniref:Uncharacterized protein n=1 Tax=Pedobacter caeni TaxID=288992 RepID=A0A1M4WDD6_9SPHI|nr:hypothetical protein [Pedobacter caeni]SHE79195.1 hypothetical protein SAMN04488522_1011227 [Pedobacter caeni]
MEQEIKSIRSRAGVFLFKQTEDKEEWFSIASDFGGFNRIEFSIHSNDYFAEAGWIKLPEFLDYLEDHLPSYIDKAMSPLLNFAKMSGYFNELEQSELMFGFGLNVIFLEPSFTTVNRWSFELDFTTSNKNDHLENVDGYGRWFVTFDGDCIRGIRRESW